MGNGIPKWSPYYHGGKIAELVDPIGEISPLENRVGNRLLPNYLRVPHPRSRFINDLQYEEWLEKQENKCEETVVETAEKMDRPQTVPEKRLNSSRRSSISSLDRKNSLNSQQITSSRRLSSSRSRRNRAIS